MTNQADSKLAGRDSFSDLGAATVHEAAAGIGALPSSIKPLSGEFRLFGAAFTVKFPPADNLWLHRAIYAAPTGSGSGYPQASDGLEAQARGMFADVGRARRGRRRQGRARSQDDDLGVRPRRSKVIDPHWLELVPDAESRLASHTSLTSCPIRCLSNPSFWCGVTEWQPRTATESSIIH